MTNGFKCPIETRKATAVYVIQYNIRTLFFLSFFLFLLFTHFLIFFLFCYATLLLLMTNYGKNSVINDIQYELIEIKNKELTQVYTFIYMKIQQDLIITITTRNRKIKL